MGELPRETLRRLLIRWQSGQLDDGAAHAEAQRLWESEDWPEFPEADPRSIAIEVLSQLDIMDHQLITAQDIPAFLRFLDTPEGEEQVGWQEWSRYWEGIDYAERERQLAGRWESLKKR